MSWVVFTYLLRKRNPEDPWPEENPLKEIVHYGRTDGDDTLTPELLELMREMADRSANEYRVKYIVEFLYHTVTITSKNERQLSKLRAPLVRTRIRGTCALLPYYPGRPRDCECHPGLQRNIRHQGRLHGVYGKDDRYRGTSRGRGSR